MAERSVIWPVASCAASFTTAYHGEHAVGLRSPFWLVINTGDTSLHGKRQEVLRFRAHRFASPAGQPLRCEWDDTDRVVEAPVTLGVPFDAASYWRRALFGRAGWMPLVGGLGPEHLRTGWLVSIQRGGATVFSTAATLGGGRMAALPNIYLTPERKRMHGVPTPSLSSRPGPVRLVPHHGRALTSLYTARKGARTGDIGSETYEWLNVHTFERDDWKQRMRTRHLSLPARGYWNHTQAGFPHTVELGLSYSSGLRVDCDTSFEPFTLRSPAGLWILSNIEGVGRGQKFPHRKDEAYALQVVGYEPAGDRRRMGMLHWMNALGGWESSVLEDAALSASLTRGGPLGRAQSAEITAPGYSLHPMDSPQPAWPHDALEQRLSGRIWAPTLPERAWLGELGTAPLAFWEPFNSQACYPARIAHAEQALGGGADESPWVRIEATLGPQTEVPEDYTWPLFGALNRAL